MGRVLRERGDHCQRNRRYDKGVWERGDGAVVRERRAGWGLAGEVLVRGGGRKGGKE